MNRIYQGRVSKVEMPLGGSLPKGKKKEIEWLPFHPDSQKAIQLRDEVLPEIAQKNAAIQECVTRRNEAKKNNDQNLVTEIGGQIDALGEQVHELRKQVKGPWEDALWDHHQLFQDAVNYYTLALVALGEGLPAEHPMTKLRGRMALAWDAFPREVASALSLGQSVRSWLGLVKDAVFEEAIKKVLSGLTVPQVVRQKALGELLEALSNGSDGVVQQKGREYLPMFAIKKCESTFPREAAMLDRRVGYFRLQTELHELHGNAAIHSFANDASCYWTANPDKGGKNKEPLIALLEAIAKLEKDKDVAALQLGATTGAEFLAGCKAAANDHKAQKIVIQPIPVTNKGGEPKAALALFKQFPGVESLAILKHYFPAQTDPAKEVKRRAKAKKDMDEAIEIDAQFLVDGKDPIEIARGPRGFVFPAFTSLEGWATKSAGDACWREFDIAAFKECIKTINQFYAKSEEREKKKEEVKSELRFIQGEDLSWKPKTTDEQEERQVFILADDPRYEKLLKLLKVMDDDRAERSKEEIVGPTEAALRGFGKLRAEWMDLYREKKGAPTEAALQEKVTDLQREHKLDMGHTDFFLKLCEETNWEIWREATPDELETQRERRWAKSVVYAAADAQELADTLKHLEDPIRYTPAEPEHSRRLFMFSDIQNKEATNHAGPGLVDVCLSVKNAEGKLASLRVRLCYEAPRMVRDEIANGDGSRWLQPMMKAMGLQPDELAHFTRDKKGKAKMPAVALMPDWVGRRRDRHFLLNFPVDLDTDAMVEKIGKAALWEKQMNAGWENGKIKQRFHLLWDDMEKKPTVPWWENKDILREGIVSLSIDMGQRRAADYALLHSLPCETPDSFVMIGEQGGHKWHTRIWNYTSPDDPRVKVSGVGSLKLPGEDAEVFIDGVLKQEAFGRKGRLSDQEDYDEAIKLAGRLLHSGDKVENWLGTTKESYSVPEQSDKLVKLFLGALSRYRTWFRWSWQLTPEHKERWERVFKKEVTKLSYFKEWEEMAALAVTPANACALQMLVAAEAVKLRAFLEEALIKIANRVAPLRDNHWRWVNLTCGETKKPLHQLVADGDKPEKKPKIRGQRGLSLVRLEQLEDFRRGILSLNRLSQHAIGMKPDFGAATLGDRLPDPCSVLTDKIVRMKEERVNQTAHMILALALGVRLKAPSNDKVHRDEHDIHGEYEAIPGRKPVDFIVLEDLSRYTTDKSRGRSENSRLMKWCHRAINEKVKLLAEPFGLPVVEVLASYTSRFDARTGGAGFRVAEVGARDRDYWKKIIEKNADMKEVFEQLDSLARSGVTNARLLIPQSGGEFFLEAKLNTKANDPTTLPKLRQADINAAVNIGLRAVAGTHCFHAHPRVRIEKVTSKDGADQQWRTKAKGNKREIAQFGKGFDVSVNLSADSKRMKDSTATLMHDRNGIASYGQATIKGYEHKPLAHSTAIFGRNKDFPGAVARLEWKICKDINTARIAAWKEKADKADPDNQIPFL